MISFFKKFSREESSEVATMPLVADMHSHYLFGLDDGAATLADSLALIQKLSEAGYKKLIATPHIMGDFYKNTPAGINARLEEVKAAVQSAGWQVELQAAAEYYLDEWFVNKLRREEQLLTFGGRYLLFETSYINQPAQLQEAIFLMQAQGYKPVMAHPERYLYLQENFNKLLELYELGVMMQVNINSVAGYYSLPAQLLAERLIDYKIVRFAGTDAHNLKHIKVLQSARAKKYYARLLDNDLLNKVL